MYPDVQRRATSSSSTPAPSGPTSASNSSSLSASGSFSSTATPPPPVTSSTTSEKPFFSVVSGNDSDDDDDSGDSRTPESKTILEFLFLTIAVLLIVFCIYRRYRSLRKHGVPLRRFFSTIPSTAPTNFNRPAVVPRTTGLPRPGSQSAYTPNLHPSELYSTSLFPISVFPQEASAARRTRAADIDASGRRMGGGMSDMDGEFTGKETLPAYDVAGGPPGYVEVDLGLASPPAAHGGQPVHGTRARIFGMMMQTFSTPAHGGERDEESVSLTRGNQNNGGTPVLDPDAPPSSSTRRPAT